MKDASLIVRYETSKYYVRNYVTTTTLLRMVALNEKRSALRPLSYSVESYVLLHRTHTHTNTQTEILRRTRGPRSIVFVKRCIRCYRVRERTVRY